MEKKKKEARNCGRERTKNSDTQRAKRIEFHERKNKFPLSETNAERSIRVPRSDAARCADLAGKKAWKSVVSVKRFAFSTTDSGWDRGPIDGGQTTLRLEAKRKNEKRRARKRIAWWWLYTWLWRQVLFNPQRQPASGSITDNEVEALRCKTAR